MSEQRPFRRKVFLLSPEFPSYGICGSRGSGKSVLLEFIEEWYYRHDYVILDWFGSIDHENAYWCVPEILAIGRWENLENDDSSKLIEYLKKRFCSEKEETGWMVQRLDENTIVCKSDNFTFELKTTKALAFGRLIVNPDTPLAKGHKLFLYKNEKGERIVYAKNPARKEGEGRVIGYPVLVILPKTTVIKQKDPLCSCGVAFADHDAAEADGWKCKADRQPLIRTITDDMPLKEIVELAHREKRICIFNRGFYGDQRDAYRTLAKMLKELPFLILRGSFSRNTCFCIGFREAGQIAPSGLKGMRGDWETNTKREIQTYIREARHLRSVLALDFQRSSDIAASIAQQRDFLFVKRSTKDLIPEHYMWMWDAIAYKKAYAQENLDFDAEDDWPPIPKLKPWESYCLFPDGHFERRYHGMANFHHKRPNDVWSMDANCEIQYLEKKDLDKDGIQKKILSLSKKKDEKARQEDVLKEADKLHEDGSTWVELAKKYGWLDKSTGLPSGDRLKMAVRRWKERQESQGNNGTK